MRGAARFPINLWNVEDRIDTGLPLTKNKLEGWHNAFQKSLSCAHPTCYRLIKSLLSEQGKTEHVYAQRQAGGPNPAPTKAKYARVQQRVSDLHRRMLNNEMSMQEYIKGIVNNIELNVE